ncbi:hypothetical protein C8Q79DRAFT_924639 [Trametes meyenii]|nr:hypothetical protein C8Q79DRAFT_924639 [Trametes meyenii]
MALFSASESVYLSSFLSSVDLDAQVSHDGQIDPNFADQIPHLQGSEALAKATKDLMSLEGPAVPQTQNSGQPSHSKLHAVASSQPSYWPSFPPGERPGSSSGAQQQQHKFAQGARPSSPTHYLTRGLSGTLAPSDSLRSGERANTSVFTSHLGQQQQQHVQIPPLRGFDGAPSSSGFSLPPISTSGFPNGLAPHEGSRPSAIPSPSGSAVPTPQSGNASTSTKRPLPSSSEPATDPSSSKRARPSPSSTGRIYPCHAPTPKLRRSATQRQLPAAAENLDDLNCGGEGAR